MKQFSSFPSSLGNIAQHSPLLQLACTIARTNVLELLEKRIKIKPFLLKLILLSGRYVEERFVWMEYEDLSEMMSFLLPGLLPSFSVLKQEFQSSG